MPSEHIEVIFPNLTDNDYRITSPFTIDYNCIAWAVGDQQKWWWPSPDSYWPPDLLRDNTLANFVQMFESMGYESCDSEKLEPEFEKIAIYTGNNDRPTHAARQLDSGLWTSKLGALEDIEHNLAGLEGEAYGTIAHIMRRRRPTEPIA